MPTDNEELQEFGDNENAYMPNPSFGGDPMAMSYGDNDQEELEKNRKELVADNAEDILNKK